MICLADNDYILKLAACDLLEEMQTLFGAERNEIYVLPSAKFKFKRDTKKQLAQKYSEAGLACAIVFVESVQEIIQKEDAETALMSEVKDPQTGKEQIDAGERVLLASTHLWDDFMLMTGDKRCLYALASAPSCATIYARHCGRVVCLEQTILWLIQRLGFPCLLQKVVHASGCDTALRSAFGSGFAATQQNVEATLQSYVDDLQRRTGGLIKQTL